MSAPAFFPLNLSDRCLVAVVVIIGVVVSTGGFSGDRKSKYRGECANSDVAATMAVVMAVVTVVIAPSLPVAALQLPWPPWRCW